MNFKEKLDENPIIAAVSREEELDIALESESEIIFVLFGNILNLREISEKIYKKRKVGIIHFDLIEGLSNSESALKFVKDTTLFRGVISTKPQIIRMAKKEGIIAIQRVFIIDSLALLNAKKYLVAECDALEMLPGLLFKVIEDLSKTIKKPLIVGGLISEKQDVIDALKCGATAISTTNKDVWLD